MTRRCVVTGKSRTVVNSVTRRGRARADGGVGRKTTGIAKGVQKANLHKKRVVVNGEVRRVWLSANALRSLDAGKVRDLVLA